MDKSPNLPPIGLMSKPILPAPQGVPPRQHPQAPTTKSLAVTVTMVMVATVIAMALRTVIPPGSVALIFLIAVLFSAVLFGFWTGIAASGLAFLAYNFFFVEPVLTFRVAYAEDFLALGVFVLVAGLTGTLAGRLREQATAAQEHARLLEHLASLSNAFGAASSEDDVRQALLLGLHGLTGATATLIDHGLLSDPPLGPHDLQAAERVLRHGTPQPAAAFGWSGGRYSFYPLVKTPMAHLVAGVQIRRPSYELDRAIISAIEQAGAAIARLHLAHAADEARLKAEGESLRSALLSSLSHDLKTPLATILGSVTTLRQLSDTLPETARDDLLQAIEEDARRLNAYVSNLLHMTRLQTGLDPRLDWVDPRDVLNGAVARIHRECPDRVIQTRMDGAPALLRTDAALLEQALFNCIDNAARAAPAGTIIAVSLRQKDDFLRFAVEDEGPGVPMSDQQRIFEAFQRGATAAPGGTGLGLAITKGIVQALGGDLGVESPLNETGGARFWLAFPVVKDAPA
ncbi:MAG: two component sensor [Beijerinckiaceae bacterium]|nr:MAG: two component sensor [Beijerinckiaceae bacterium]